MCGVVKLLKGEALSKTNGLLFRDELFLASHEYYHFLNLMIMENNGWFEGYKQPSLTVRLALQSF